MTIRSFYFIFLAFAITLTCKPTVAQQEVKLNFSYIPETQYKTKTVMSIYNRLTFEGEKDFLRGLNEAGMAMPIIMIMDQRVVSVMETGKPDSQGSFPWEIGIKEVELKISEGGEGMNLDLDELKDFKVYGVVDSSGNMITEEFTGQLDQEYEQFLANFLENLSNQISFPDEPVKVGETILITLPVSIPFAGMGAIDMFLQTEYSLNKIEDNLAFFDIAITMTMSSDMDDAIMSAEGEGKGEMIFDIDQNFPIENIAEMTMNMRVESPGFSIIGFSKNYSSTKNTIHSNRGNSEND